MPFRNRPRMFRAYLIFAVLTLIFLAAYLQFLSYQDRKMAAYYAQLRQEHPDMYLEKMAELRGFDAYVAEFQKMRDYSQPRAEVPPFLVGRWRLFEEPRNVSERYFPEACLSGIELEDGRVKMFGLFNGDYGARYRIDGMKVDIALGADGHIPVRLISYGSHLHHLELTLPGQAARYYGYLCK